MGKRFFLKKYLRKKKIAQIPLVTLGAMVSVFILYNIIFIERIFPGIWVGGVSVGGKTPQEAAIYLEKNIPVPAKILLTNQNQNFEIETKSFGLAFDFKESAAAAYGFDRTGNIFYDFNNRLKAFGRHENLGLRLKLDEAALQSTLSSVAGQVAQDPVYPSAKLVKNKVVVNPGKKGTDVDIKKLRIEIGRALSSNDGSLIHIPTETVDPTLSDEEVGAFRARAENLIGKTLSINFEFQTFSFRGNTLLPLLAPKGGVSEEKIKDEIATVAKDVERVPQNPTFVFAGGRVSEFTPAKDGVKVKGDELKGKIIEALSSLETKEDKEISFDIPVIRTPPEIKTGDVNNLGIKELVGRGVSHFAHSIPSRIHNVVLAASRLNGILVKPGDTFSFNNVLGDVSEFTGYQQAYIIKEGKTVLGDGGGVCQVSTTLFRAVLNAGLPITERAAHAYRVGYYEQDSSPGFDATVYSPSPDFKFKNDTPGYILIQATANPKTVTLVFELYGTKDGRVATTTKPRVSDLVAPPDDLYQDDPTLPSGTIKQIDFKAWGAKVVFDYDVQKDGQNVYHKTFVSNFRPWQAVYLRGTGPAQ